MINIKSVLTTLFNNIIELKNTKADISTVQDIQYSHTLDFKVTKGDNYSSVTINNVYLIGNLLRIYFSATRSSATGTGNIGQDIIFTIKIYTQDLFTTLHNINTINYSSGTLHNLSTGYRSFGSDDKGSYVEFSLQINATHGAVTSTNGLFAMVAGLDTTKY